MNTFLVVAAIVLGLIGIGCYVLLYVRQKNRTGPFSTLDMALFIASFPITLVAIALGVASFSNKFGKKKPARPGDEDVDVNLPAVDVESTGDKLVRVVEANAEKVVKHLEENATDDEVAARGAALFDVDDSEPEKV